MIIDYGEQKPRIKKEFVKNYKFLKIRNNVLIRVEESEAGEQKAQFVLPRSKIEEII